MIQTANFSLYAKGSHLDFDFDIFLKAIILIQSLNLQIILLAKVNQKISMIAFLST